MTSSPGRQVYSVHSEEFARTITKQAAAHVCVAQGFTSTTEGVLECLAEVKILAHASRVKLVDDAGVLRLWQIQHYLEDLARHTMQNTRRGGRVEANLADVLQAFQEMPIPIKWQDLREFAFSRDGYSGPKETKGEAHAAGKGAGVGGAASGAASATTEGGKGASAASPASPAADVDVYEPPKRWDHPFQHAVPEFPIPWSSERRGEQAGEADKPAASGPALQKHGDDGDDGEGPGVRPPHIPDFMPPIPPGTRYKRPREERSNANDNLTEVRMDRVKRQREGEAALRNLGAPAGTVEIPSTAVAPSSSERPSSSDRGSGTGSRETNSGAQGLKRSGSEGEIKKIKISAKLPVPSASSSGGSGSSSGPGGNSGARGFPHSRRDPPGGFSRGVDSGVGRHEAPPRPRFRAIPASAVATASHGKGRASGVDGKESSGGEGGSGSWNRGRNGKSGSVAFKLNDASREDRILEGMAPDGTGDIEGAT